MKLTACALIIASCYAYGLSLSKKSKQQLEEADGMLKLLEYISLRIPTLHYLEEIVDGFECQALSKNSFLQTLRNKNVFVPFNERFSVAIECFEDNKELYLCLKTVAEGLGTLDLERQQRVLSACTEELKLIVQRLREVYATKAKCYRSLGALLGMMISVLLI